MTSTFVLRGRCVLLALLCVAGVGRRFTGQAWHLMTSTFVLRGRRDTSGTGLGLVTGLVPLWRCATLRGRRGTSTSFHFHCVSGGSGLAENQLANSLKDVARISRYSAI